MSEDAEKSTEKAGPSAHTAALHSIDEVRELLAGAALEDLDGLTALLEEKLEHSRAAVEHAVRERGEPLDSMLHGLEAELRDEIRDVEQRIRENPLPTLVAAAGAGLLLGLALGRRR
jgi:ElaB/YqjD/DUF883 family membrane-anchored ribosome-binding protein